MGIGNTYFGPAGAHVLAASMFSRFGEVGTLWDLIWRQTRGCF
jgi:hypothetical protein